MPQDVDQLARDTPLHGPTAELDARLHDVHRGGDGRGSSASNASSYVEEIQNLREPARILTTAA